MTNYFDFCNSSKGHLWNRINSALISYKIMDYEFTNGSHVTLVFQHPKEAKNPANVRKIRRRLKPGETASAVMGSSYCVYLQYPPLTLQ